MTTRLIVAGFGGQGVMLIGQILGQCAFEQGLQATVLPTYGVEQRGGTANTTVVLSDRAIASPVADSPDVLCALNQPSVERYRAVVRPGGCVIVNRCQASAEVGRADVTVIPVPADDLAMELGSMKVSNIIMLGVFIGYTGAISFETTLQVVKKKLSKKPEFEQMNENALRAGYELGRGAAGGAGA